MLRPAQGGSRRGRHLCPGRNLSSHPAAIRLIFRPPGLGPNCRWVPAVEVRHGSPGEPSSPFASHAGEAVDVRAASHPSLLALPSVLWQEPPAGHFHLRLGNPSRGEHRGRRSRAYAATPAFPVRPTIARPQSQFAPMLGNISSLKQTPQFSNAAAPSRRNVRASRSGCPPCGSPPR